MTKSKNRDLHIVSFDIPVPVNYGGAIDVFYKLKTLKEHGVDIYLHCFMYGGRKPAPELNNLCKEVYYYSRKKLAHDIIGNMPYIINSRKDDTLIENLLKDNYPILFEGIHSCFYLSDERLRNRLKIVRTHNIEHEYYANLARTEKNYFRKLYYINESKLLRDFEENLKFADSLAVISKNDYNYFSQKFKKVFLVSAFHPNETVDIMLGKGKYALYHGSLEVNENHHAAMYLINEVFSSISCPLIIAGNKPKTELQRAVENISNVEIRIGLSISQIHKLVQEAHINVLPTFQATGIKLKLLLALYQGRHCVVNSPMVIDTGLENLCHIADNSAQMASSIENLFKVPMTEDAIAERKKVLLNNGFINRYNVKVLMQRIFEIK